MKHTQAWLDNLADNLMTAIEFFAPKNWSDKHNGIWERALTGCSANQITEAFSKYYERGKHMPKPAEILTIVRERHPSKTDREREDQRTVDERTRDEGGECNAIVASAWLIFNRIQSGLTIKFEEQGGPARIRVPMTDEHAILICNHEAKRTENPHAINKMFWIEGIWGHPKPDASEPLPPRKHKSSYGPVPDYNSILQERAA